MERGKADFHCCSLTKELEYINVIGDIKTSLPRAPLSLSGMAAMKFAFTAVTLALLFSLDAAPIVWAPCAATTQDKAKHL